MATRIRFIEVTHDGDPSDIIKTIIASIGGKVETIPAQPAPAALPPVQEESEPAPVRQVGDRQHALKGKGWSPERRAKMAATIARRRAMREQAEGGGRPDDRPSFPATASDNGDLDEL